MRYDMVDKADGGTDMALRVAVGQAIRERRKNWPGGMTLHELARRSGLAVGTLSNYETGRCTPSLEAAMRLANELGIDLNQIARSCQSQPL
jgi:transcriptional regulator with XRE-family HTH domain